MKVRVQKNSTERGITLIALIITIIVLLILAGVSIALVVGDNGVLSNAIDAVEQTGLAGAQEVAELAIVSAQAEYYTAKANGETDKTQTEYITMKLIRKNLSSEYTYCYEDSTAENTDDDDTTLAEMTANNNSTFYITTDSVIYAVTYDINSDGDVTNVSVTVVDSSTLDDTDVETISTEESYIGAYADVDGDGEVDGIIYADLAFTEEGYWSPAGHTGAYITYSTYSYDAINADNLREYYISQDSYTDTYFGINAVITPVSGTEGEQRFYILELDDHEKNETSTATNTYNTFCWWYSAYSSDFEGTTVTDYKTLTSTEFGSGLTNSINMKAAWENETYGVQNYSSIYDDIWSLDDIGKSIGDSNSVWFVPSIAELSAFADAFEIYSEHDYSSLGLWMNGWSSSLYTSQYAFCIVYYGGYINYGAVFAGGNGILGSILGVRLGSIF